MTTTTAGPPLLGLELSGEGETIMRGHVQEVGFGLPMNLEQWKWILRRKWTTEVDQVMSFVDALVDSTRDNDDGSYRNKDDGSIDVLESLDMVSTLGMVEQGKMQFQWIIKGMKTEPLLHRMDVPVVENTKTSLKSRLG